MPAITQAQLRADWATRQGLGDPRPAHPVDLITERGWPRTLGGAEAYLSVMARSGPLQGSTLDDAVEAGELWVLPAARGCIYVVPRVDVPLALRWGWLTAKRRTDLDVTKAGTSWEEIEGIATVCFEVLQTQELSTQKLRRALPDGTVRSLGERGKKVGMSSPMPLALRLLESRGRIRRVQATGRLDKETYAWRVLETSPFEGVDLAEDTAGLAVEIGRRFLQHSGPATRKELAAWSGCGQRDAKAALEALGAVVVDVEGANPKDPFHVLPDEVDSVGQGDPGGWALVPMIDPWTDYRSLLTYLADSADHDREFRVGGARTKPLHALKTVWQRVLVYQGRLAGLWEYDPEAESVVAGLFRDVSSSELVGLEERMEEVTRFLRDDLGHGRSFSLDTSKSMMGRVAVVRGLDRIIG